MDQATIRPRQEDLPRPAPAGARKGYVTPRLETYGPVAARTRVVTDDVSSGITDSGQL
ncbi:MAG TPA: hypothetical protein VFC42_07575 [Methylomirabilota bacterium]|jgi:hypothetical protein|nr:hypothetical protein [Methylomirabilota bacterium]